MDTFGRTQTIPQHVIEGSDGSMISIAQDELDLIAGRRLIDWLRQHDGVGLIQIVETTEHVKVSVSPNIQEDSTTMRLTIHAMSGKEVEHEMNIVYPPYTKRPPTGARIWAWIWFKLQGKR